LLGFDGEYFVFKGQVGRTYNILSTPSLQFNSKVERGLDETGLHVVAEGVPRTVGVLWNENHRLRYSIDQTGDRYYTPFLTSILS
jgi:hypothetical protein